METSIKPLVPGDDLEKQWKFFQWQWDGFVTFNETRAAWSKEKQASALMHFIGLDCAYLYETATAAVKRDPDLLNDHISNIVKPVTNDCFERYLFKTFSRKEGEDVNLFVARCREKLDRCGYSAGYNKDFLIVDALVHNLSDLTLQQHFFRTKDLKLAKVIEDLQVHEAGQAQLKEIQTCRAKVTPVVSVNPVTESRSERQGRSRTRSSSSGARKPSRSRSSSKSRSYSKSRSSSKSKQEKGKDRRRSNSRSNHKSYRARSQTPKRVSTDDDSDCQNCGYSHGTDWCPARDKKCHDCGREKRFPIDPAKLSSKMWAEYVECDFGSIQVKLDTGAEVNVMPKRLLDKVRGRVYVLKPTPIVLEVYGGALLRPLGTIIFQNCVLNNTSLDLEFIVADVESVPLLCLGAVERYGFITRVTSNSLKPISSFCKVSIHACKTATLSYPSVENPNQVNVISSKKVTFSDKCSSINKNNEIISSNPEVFSTEAGCFPHLYSLEVDQSKRPIGVPSRRVPHSVKDRSVKTLEAILALW
ncbi:Lysylphosphatidylglycerol biosynthesis bifunctional protein LysX [Frankliniella fusca]|uniref:Lysylphosphatidylglycerol biosynthesis bifunctional protein LysX n=1 Tax=Frankliniella fusca TaxID=407009 RepID=A0AAE1H225_9NEOP|nr:Lysylphosphatidylglycerol biosynthesis bifunctional protein LysX [Frankliniella fusca]